MPTFEDITGMRINGMEAVEAKYGGHVVWPADGYFVELAVDSFDFTAAGGNFTIQPYGVHYRFGQLVSRVALSWNQITTRFLADEDYWREWIDLADHNMKVIVLNAGTVVSAAKAVEYEVSWNAYPEARPANAAITRGANSRHASGAVFAELSNTFAPISWHYSGTGIALKSGDWYMFSKTVRVDEYQKYVWDSGAEQTERVGYHTDNSHSTVSVTGEGLTHTVGAATIRIDYASNEGASRTGALAFTFNDGTYSKTWNYELVQEANIPNAIVILYRGQLWQSIGRYVDTGFVVWEFIIGGSVYDWFTPDVVEIGDPIYQDPTLTLPVSEATIANAIY